MIPVINYTDAKIFELEKEKYFSKNFFVGTDSDLSQINDYKTVTNFFHPITIRNVGELKVFSNVCLHRSGLIDIKEHGNAPFSCKYHGWAYSSDGTVFKTPLDHSMAQCGRRLQEITSKCLSGFIFTNPSRNFVNKFLPICEKYINKKSKFFYRNSILHNCNWKILVENVLEPYHISFVHKNSFVEMGLSSTSIYKWDDLEIGTYNEVRSKADESKYYNHLSIGPNLFISDTNGFITFVSYFFPISPSKTLLTYELWENLEVSKKKDYVRRRIQEASIDFTNKVLMEDKEIVEASQIGIEFSKNDHILSEIAEPRVINFHNKYFKTMDA